MEHAAHDTRYYVDVVAEAGELLRAFTASPYRFTLTELSLVTGLSKNKTFRLLYTLTQTGFVHQDVETKRYSLGLPVLYLASALQASNELLLAARDTLDWLQDTVGERINLGGFDGADHAVCVDTRESSRRMQVSAYVGARFPLHAGAVPKALLAFSTDDAIAQYLERNLPLRAFTSRTAQTAGDLWEEIHTIRQQGMAISDEDLDDGVGAVAMPIFDRTGAVVAAVSIATPMARFGPDDRGGYEQALHKASERISRSLGFVAMPGRRIVKQGFPYALG